MVTTIDFFSKKMKYHCEVYMELEDIYTYIQQK